MRSASLALILGRCLSLDFLKDAGPGFGGERLLGLDFCSNAIDLPAEPLAVGAADQVRAEGVPFEFGEFSVAAFRNEEGRLVAVQREDLPDVHFLSGPPNQFSSRQMRNIVRAL